MSTLKNYESRLLTTAAIYSLLSSSFTSDPKTIQKSVNSLREIFDKLGMTEESNLADNVINIIKSDENASAEYVRLFEMGAAPPCETAYTCAENMEHRTYELADIAGFYRAFNVKQSTGTPDHIKAELEFMALIMVKELLAHENSNTEAAEICRDARRKFYREHLSRWVGEWVKKVRENARKPLYIILTELVSRIVSKHELVT